MDSFLIIAGNEEERLKRAEEIIANFQILPFDTFILKPDILKKELSIGITEVRQLEKWLSLKPYQSPKKAAIIYQAEKLTLEAQNALLKNLEEPPERTIFILLSENAEALIPTISSRCQIIKISSKNKLFLNSKEEKQFANYFPKIFSLPLEEKFKEAEEISQSRETALSFIDKGIFFLRKVLLTSQKISFLPYQEIPKAIKGLSEAKNYINSNVSPRLVLEVFFLNFSS